MSVPEQRERETGRRVLLLFSPSGLDAGPTGCWADRMLVAQAMVENMGIVTRNQSIADYDVDVIVA